MLAKIQLFALFFVFEAAAVVRVFLEERKRKGQDSFVWFELGRQTCSKFTRCSSVRFGYPIKTEAAFFLRYFLISRCTLLTRPCDVSVARLKETSDLPRAVFCLDRPEPNYGSGNVPLKNVNTTITPTRPLTPDDISVFADRDPSDVLIR